MEFYLKSANVFFQCETVFFFGQLTARAFLELLDIEYLSKSVLKKENSFALKLINNFLKFLNFLHEFFKQILLINFS